MLVCLPRLSLCLATVLASGLAISQSQQGRLERMFEQAVQKLTVSDQRVDALRLLENLGSLAAPSLKTHLQRQQRGQLSRQQQLDLLYVTSAIGKPAIQVLPELLAWLEEEDRETIAALFDTLSHVALHLEQKELALLGDKIRDHTVGHGDICGHALAQVRLGAHPTVDQLITNIGDYEFDAVAACRKICAAPRKDANEVEQLTAAVRTRLQAVSQREFLSMQRATALTSQAPDELVARGLLNHRIPEQRLRGVLWLREYGRDLPAEKRCDLVVRLWDGDDSIVAAAATALGHWRSQGTLALPALTLMADQHRCAAVQVAAASAAQAIAASLQTMPPSDRPWLLGAYAILTDQVVATPTTEPSGNGKRALAELLMMAQWQSQERLSKLLSLAASAQPDLEMVGSVYPWLSVQDPPLIDAVLSWLARHSRLAIDASDQMIRGEHERRWAELARTQVPRVCRGTALEATAWFRTPPGLAGDCADLLNHDNARVQARALAELVLHPTERLQQFVPRLRWLANLPSTVPLLVVASRQQRTDTYPYLLAEPVRMLAAMALARVNKIPRDQNGITQLVRKHFACSLEELPEVIAGHETAGTLADLVEGFEVMCRRALYVPKQLQWPRAGQIHER